MNNDVIQALAQALAPHLGRGPVARATGTPDTGYALYSAGGLFGTCDSDPTLINALVSPFGYGAVLTWMGSKLENEITDSFTCIESSTYDQSTDCAACGKPTLYKCAQATCFGRLCQKTDEMVFDRIGLMANAGVPVKVLYGNITDPFGNILYPQGSTMDNALLVQAQAAAYNLRRRVGQLMWAGDPANNVGGYEEPAGFDLLINTGKADARTGADCDGLDSTIMDFGSSVVGATGSPSIVQYVSGMVRTIRYRIDTGGFGADGAEIDIVMHPTLWDCVAAAWACEYGLQCNSWTSDGIRGMSNDALAVADLRDKFMSAMSIPIDGKYYRVVLDNGIETANSDQLRCSDIYVITRTLPGAPNGGLITYGEYQDLNATAGSAIAFLKKHFGGANVDITDGGRYLLAYDTSGSFCFDVSVLLKWRMRSLMPQLSGRVTNVCCDPWGTYPDPSGSGLDYDICGGATDSSMPYLYGDCFDGGLPLIDR